MALNGVINEFESIPVKFEKAAAAAAATAELGMFGGIIGLFVLFAGPYKPGRFRPGDALYGSLNELGVAYF
jgi:hypothetical protein